MLIFFDIPYCTRYHTAFIYILKPSILRMHNMFVVTVQFRNCRHFIVKDVECQ